MAAEATQKNVVALNTVVTREVDQDEISITFETMQSGPDSTKVQEALVHYAQEALLDAKNTFADNSAVRVETGSFSVTPRYGKKGTIDGYDGVAQMIVKGTDTAAISKFAGDLKVMNVAGIDHAVSRAVRIALESEMATDAIKAFRTRAAQYAADFGMKTFSLLNANVSVNLQNQHRGGARMMSAALSMNESAGGSIPVSAGKEVLTAQVAGTIQLK